MPDQTQNQALSESEQQAVDASIEDFCELASKFIEMEKLDEAIEVYERASRIYPDSIALKINLGRVRNLQKQHEEGEVKELETRFAKHRRQKDLLSVQFNSLGATYMDKNQIPKAVELFEMAKANNPNFPKPFRNLGRIYYKNNEFAMAAKELKKALDCNPFDEEVNSLLGRSLFYLKKYRLALNALLDAFIISGSKDPDRTNDYQEKIRYLFEKLEVHNKPDRSDIVKERTQRLNRLVEALEGAREKYRETHQVADVRDILVKAQEKKDEQRELLQLALRLKNFTLLSDLNDEDLFRVAKKVRVLEVEKDDVIFSQEDSSDDIYLIERGQVRVVRNTPFGEQALATIEEGEFFGEMNFIDGQARSAEAVANTPATLVVMSRANMAPLFDTRKEVAVQFFWHFWKSLARRTRQSNERLKTFFQDSRNNQTPAADKETIAEAKKISIDLDKKLKVLQERGLLSAKELRLLATFSNEELYNKDDVIFLEGTEGDKLYIILDGQVRISKHIPGIGEEALAILEPGDFFGEMALIDRERRSADARSHSHTVTLLTITNDVLNEILSVDIESAYQFLGILCRILTQRLREINLKIIQWRLMSGGF